MPSKIPIRAPLREALLECFAATVRLARPLLRDQVVLVGGLTCVAHRSAERTGDVDFAATKPALNDIATEIMDGARDFQLDPDGKIVYDASLGPVFLST